MKDDGSDDTTDHLRGQRTTDDHTLLLFGDDGAETTTTSLSERATWEFVVPR
jgi:hypothetical protein